jgi:hypothetical protein
VGDHIDDLHTVLFQRPPGFDQVHDPLGQTHEGSELDGAGQRDELDRNATGVEVVQGDSRVLRRDAYHGTVARESRLVFPSGEGDPALPEAEIERLEHVRAALQQHIATGDPRVGGAVFHVGGRVHGLDQNHPTTPVGRVEDEASRRGRVLGETDSYSRKQIQRGFEKPAFRDRDHEHRRTLRPAFRSRTAASNRFSSLGSSPSASETPTTCSRRSTL